MFPLTQTRCSTILGRFLKGLDSMQKLSQRFVGICRMSIPGRYNNRVDVGEP